MPHTQKVPVHERKIPGAEPEPELDKTAGWHPYVLYIVLTAVIFAIMIFIGYLALSQGWVVRK